MGQEPARHAATVPPTFPSPSSQPNTPEVTQEDRGLRSTPSAGQMVRVDVRRLDVFLKRAGERISAKLVMAEYLRNLKDLKCREDQLKRACSFEFKEFKRLKLEVYFANRRHFITSDRMQILDLLFSTYESALQKARELEQANKKLQEALETIKTLEGILPICAACKKIRDESGQWQALERHIGDRSNATFSHSLCPECARNLYPQSFGRKDSSVLGVAGMDDARHVLVVEDSLTQAVRLQAVLESLGYAVRRADDGQKALDLLDQDFCPLVITGWVMPEMDGVTFCQRVRCRSYPGYVYVILLTAKDALDDIVAGLEAGADDDLIKPVHPAELAARLKTAQRILNLEATIKKRTEEVERLSITDPLTGVYNRRYLSEQLPKLLHASHRQGRPLSLVISDIDHFKKINEIYGHPTGDAVLQHFAALMQRSLRTGVDWIARFGGEEFVVVLPETAIDQAAVAAERLRLLTAHSTVESPKGPVRFTASFGVAGVPASLADKVSLEALVAAADAALYRAKENGRNRTEVHQGDFPVKM